MLRVGYEALSGRYLLVWMPLHGARRAVNVGLRSGVEQEDCVILCVRRYLVLRSRKRCGRMLAR